MQPASSTEAYRLQFGASENTKQHSVLFRYVHLNAALRYGSHRCIEYHTGAIVTGRREDHEGRGNTRMADALNDDGPALLRSLLLYEWSGALTKGAGGRGGGPGLGSGGAITDDDDAAGRSGSGLVGVGGAGTEGADGGTGSVACASGRDSTSSVGEGLPLRWACGLKHTCGDGQQHATLLLCAAASTLPMLSLSNGRWLCAGQLCQECIVGSLTCGEEAALDDCCAAGAALRLRSCASSAARRARSQLDTSFLTAVLAISWLLFSRRPVDGSVSRPRANLRQADWFAVLLKAAKCLLASSDQVRRCVIPPAQDWSKHAARHLMSRKRGTTRRRACSPA